MQELLLHYSVITIAIQQKLLCKKKNRGTLKKCIKSAARLLTSNQPLVVDQCFQKRYSASYSFPNKRSFMELF